MPIEMTMPRLSDTMEVGTVVKWNVKEGDTVSAGDVVADIETDKATMELQTFDDGTVAKLVASEGQEVAVGALIMVLAGEGESVEDAAKGAASSAGQGGSTQQTESRQQSAGSASGSGVQSASATIAAEPPAPTQSAGARNGSHRNERVFASPLARKIAAEKGIDLAGVHGSGPSGRIVRADVESLTPGAQTSRSAGATSAPSAPAPLPMAGATLEEKVVPLSNMRSTIARRLVESKQTIPHYQVSVSARIDALMDLREQLNEQLEAQGVKLSVNDFIMRACALAMHQHPHVNSSWVAEGPKASVHIHGNVNIGMAIALPEERGGGLVVATIRDTDRKGLRQISQETRHLAKKAREKGLTVEEMADSTFTVSNLGMMGVDHFTAIINPPNVAILAVGQAIRKAFVADDAETGEPILEVGYEMTMTMSSDHRIVDGAMAAAYLNTVKGYLEAPATLLV